MTLQRSPLKRSPKRRKTSPMKAADELFSRLVRERDKCCVRCGSTDRLQCAHVWSRRYRSLRWRLENAVTLCSGCHFFMTTHPAEWAEWCEVVEFSERGVSRPHAMFVGVESWSYAELRHRALNGEPEKPKNALARLRVES